MENQSKRSVTMLRLYKTQDINSHPISKNNVTHLKHLHLTITKELYVIVALCEYEM